MRIMTVVGARPQFVKAAVLSRAFKQHRPDVEEILVHTGQHYDANMSDVFFRELEIPRPEYNLEVGGGPHGQNTGRMLERIEQLSMDLKPDWLMVYGDTDSTLAGALAAAKLHVPIVHVEAGLRSFNRRMPEEINRVLTDHLSEVLFAPTASAKKNLVREGIRTEKIHVFGDVMYDAAKFYVSRARAPDWAAKLGIGSGSFALCTIHRAENTNDSDVLERILRGLGQSQARIVLPLHPRTRKRVDELGIAWPSNLAVVDPVGYLEMVWLEANCTIVLTDSGGVQKEAYIHGKPCITLREETEWTELVDSGWNHLAGSDSKEIARLVESVFVPKLRPDFYGDGNAAKLMVAAIP